MVFSLYHEQSTRGSDRRTEPLCCLTKRTLTSVVVGVGDVCAAEGADCVCLSVLGDGPETQLTENVTAGLTAVRAEVDIKADSTGEAFTVGPLLLTVQQQAVCTLSLNMNKDFQQQPTPSD